MNLQPRLYAPQGIQKPPFEIDGRNCRKRQQTDASNQNGARSNTASLRLNVRPYPILKLLFCILVKGFTGRLK